jgi:hypothetical protein
MNTTGNEEKNFSMKTAETWAVVFALVSALCFFALRNAEAAKDSSQ